MAVKRHVQHVKSSQLNKVPTAQDLMYGEIAVNYAKDGETLFIKNNEGEIVSFPNSKIIEENEFVIASHLAELDDKISKSNNTFEEKERVIAEALVEHNDRLDELDTVIEDNEHVTAEALSQIRRDLDELDEISAAALYQTNLKVKEIEDLNISGQFEITAQALSDLDERINNLSTSSNEILNIFTTELIKPNTYTIVRSPNANLEINLKEEGFSTEKTYKIEFGKDNVPNLESIEWPDNIIWEGNNEPDASDFRELGYNNWLVTIENGYLGSYKRYWRDEEEESFGIKINTSNGQNYTLDCSEIPNGQLTSEIRDIIKPMSGQSFITLGDCITSADSSVFNYSNLPNVSCIRFENCTFINVGAYAFDRHDDSVSQIVSGDIRLGCDGVTTNIGEYAFYGCKGFNSITLGPDCVFTGNSYGYYSPFNSTRSKTVNYDVPNSTRSNLFDGAIIDTVNIGPNVVTIPREQFEASQIKDLNISEGITTIGDYAFKANKFQKLVLPNSLQTISGAGFSQCSNVKELVIGTGLTSAGAYAFGTFNSLEKITCYATTPPTLNANAFTSTTSTVLDNVQVFVPAESVNAYKSASVWSRFASHIQAIPTE